MKVKRLKNLDLVAYLNKDEISKIEQASEGEVIASGEIEDFNQKKLELIYSSKKDIYSDRGVDCSDVRKRFGEKILPVYITRRDIAQRLRKGDYCGSSFFQYKLELKAKE